MAQVVARFVESSAGQAGQLTQIALAAIIVRAARSRAAAAAASAIANRWYRQRQGYFPQNGKHTGIGWRRRGTAGVNRRIVSVIEDWINQRVEFFGDTRGALVGRLVAGGVHSVRK